MVRVAYLIVLVVGTVLPLLLCVTIRFGVDAINPDYPGDATWGVAMGLLAAGAVAMALSLLLLAGLRYQLKRQQAAPPLPLRYAMLLIVSTNAVATITVV